MRAAGQSAEMIDARVTPATYAGVVLVSAAALGLEVVCMRIFSFTIWYHFAYLTINGALLGFCSAGTVLAVWPEIPRRLGRHLLWISSLSAAVTGGLFLLLAAKHPLQPQELFEAPWTFSRDLAVYYLGISLPFFLIGITIVAAMTMSRRDVARIYFADLVGAGAGAAAALALMFALEPPAAAIASTGMLVLGAACFAWQDGRRLLYALCSLLAPLGVAVLWAAQRLEFIPSASTQVAHFIENPAAFRLVHQAWNSVGRVDIYESTDPTSEWSYPQWTYDGNSPLVQPRDRPPPPSYILMGDAHTRTDIFRHATDPDDHSFLDHHLLKLPYLLKQQPDVLIVGSGGGGDVLNARRNHAASVAAIELQPLVVRLLKNELSSWVGGLYTGQPGVTLLAQEARSFLKGDRRTYDLIQFTSADTWAAQNRGAYVLTESYLYTTEAFADYLDHLEPDGILCLLVWDGVRERGEPLQPANSRLILGYLEVMQARAVRDPRQHLVIVGKREWYGSTFTVPLLKKSPFTEQELHAVRSFAQQEGFEMLYDPESPSSNGVLARLINASAEERRRMVDEAFYDIRPSTDDRPFFFDSFRWHSIFGADSLTWYQPAAGKLVLALMLTQSVALACLCIGLPLLFGGTVAAFERTLRYPFVLYFLGIGVAYMFVEISMIQKFVVFLGYPAYAFAAIACSLLGSSGLGSYFTTRIRLERTRLLAACTAVIAGLLLLYNEILPGVFQALLDANHMTKVAATVLLQAPLGFVMGMFMPVGLGRAMQMSARLGAWAWGLNGIGSVVSTVLAIVVAMSYGFRVVTYAAIVIYVMAAAMMWLLLSVVRKPQLDATQRQDAVGVVS